MLFYQAIPNNVCNVQLLLIGSRRQHLVGLQHPARHHLGSEIIPALTVSVLPIIEKPVLKVYVQPLYTHTSLFN